MAVAEPPATARSSGLWPGVVPDWARGAVASAGAAGEDIGEALRLAVSIGARLPNPGQGATSTRWAVLSAIAGASLTVARVLEAHCDALAILDEAGVLAPHGSWGVFAAEAPPARLEATLGTDDSDGATLHGTKPWCSLGDRLDHALVTARVADQRQLFRVDLRAPQVHAAPASGWVARGLRTVTSVPVEFDRAPAVAVGEPGWYLRRPGFSWGGIGVAACWHGGAVGVAATVRRAAERRPGELPDMHVGAIDTALFAAESAMGAAAAQVDAGAATGTEGELLALRVRSVVADTVERVLQHAAHALGPGPLAFDAEHAARVADLELYVRQHHAERDLAALGALLSEPGPVVRP